MSPVTLRVLTGLLSVGFVYVIFFSNSPSFTLKHKIGGGIIAIGFALYSLFGNVGERFIGHAFGCGELDQNRKPNESGLENKDDNARQNNDITP